ncbi:MAG TPA: hypothetical protein VML92_06920 [Steroidobacteraceae bacterium]|nr:hypothetical protein [Steroidobacteraceae bacterium]
MKTSMLSSMIAMLILIVPATAIGDSATHDHGYDDKQKPPSPLVEKVRKATARFRDINVAIAEGYAAGPCVSGPNRGAMGVHLINTALLTKDVDAETPEALIYEPSPDGSMRLVGVEIITLAADWVNEVPVLDGHLLHYVGAPNRYGIPAFYEIHVWAWRNNPDGTFADWNPRVSCAGQPLPIS